jgi:hypothetical protein
MLCTYNRNFSMTQRLSSRYVCHNGNGTYLKSEINNNYITQSIISYKSICFWLWCPTINAAIILDIVHFLRFPSEAFQKLGLFASLVVKEENSYSTGPKRKIHSQWQDLIQWAQLGTKLSSLNTWWRKQVNFRNPVLHKSQDGEQCPKC